VAAAAGGALLATTVRLPGDDLPLADPDEIEGRVGHAVDLFLDGGWGGVEPSTVVELAEGGVEVIREGVGDPAPFA
jgi:tRNA A37 threonylcarbamoyladenosine synthetase subunit TsaC/SUA5/YrdC